MIVLVDYDNLRLRQRGLLYFVKQLVGKVGVSWSSRETSIRCRLYGGWFDGRRLSKRAQRLVPELKDHFPRRMAISVKSRVVHVLVTMELAESLVGDKIKLTHTYRPRSLPADIACVSPPFPQCARPTDCTLSGLAPFVNNNECPSPRCDVTPTSVLWRGEQKLVDSMLVVDLVRLSQTAKEPIVLVSSDDDMWPGIRAALLTGARVLHVSTRKPQQYQRLTTSTYSRVSVRL